MLETAVFLCGAAVMVIELTGSRIMAPFLGTARVVWTSQIGVILAAMSAGYWWDRRLADRWPERRLLGRIILSAASATATVAGAKAVVLSLFAVPGRGAARGRRLGGAASLRAAGPALWHGGAVCGAAQAFAQTHRLENRRKSLRHIDIGSIVGAFAAGFALIAWQGSTNILLLVAAVLALTRCPPPIAGQGSRQAPSPSSSPCWSSG
jgi:hypothetical protein